MAISNRDFVPGTRVSVKFKSVVHTAEAFGVEGKAKLSWRIVEPADFVAPVDAETDKGLSGGDDRKTFQSIGYAEMGIFGRRTGPSEYQFWTLEADFNPETAHDYGVRTVTRGPKEAKPKVAKAAKVAKAKVERKPKGEKPKVKSNKRKARASAPVADTGEYRVIHKLEGNDTTWFCDMCAAPFDEIAGVVPEVCPNGHTQESALPTPQPVDIAVNGDTADEAEVTDEAEAEPETAAVE